MCTSQRPEDTDSRRNRIERQGLTLAGLVSRLGRRRRQEPNISEPCQGPSASVRRAGVCWGARDGHVGVASLRASGVSPPASGLSELACLSLSAAVFVVANVLVAALGRVSATSSASGSAGIWMPIHDVLRQRMQPLTSAMTSNRIFLYCVFSVFAVVATIANACRAHSNFYSVSIYLSRSSRSVLVRPFLCVFSPPFTRSLDPRQLWFPLLPPLRTCPTEDLLWYSSAP